MQREHRSPKKHRISQWLILKRPIFLFHCSLKVHFVALKLRPFCRITLVCSLCLVKDEPSPALLQRTGTGGIRFPPGTLTALFADSRDYELLVSGSRQRSPTVQERLRERWVEGGEG